MDQRPLEPRTTDPSATWGDGRSGPEAAKSASLLSRTISSSVLGFGVIAISIPTLVKIAQQNWSYEQGQQGPIVLAIAGWLMYRSWPSARACEPPDSATMAFICALLASIGYILGRMSSEYILESFCLYGLGLSVLYAFVGVNGLKKVGFPLLFLGFALPVPFAITWPITAHLRLWISQIVVAVLQLCGFSIARDGLDINIDQYTLAIQDACSGMNSLVSLSAIGLMYINVARQPKASYYILMLPFIVFFAVIGNLARVFALVLLTHYLGDRAAQGLLHETAGLITFSAALAGVIAVDRLAAFIFNRRRLRA